MAHDSTQAMHAVTNANTCEHALEAIAGRDFRHWSGFPPDCAYTAFDARFPTVHRHYGSGRLGRTGRVADYRMHPIDGYKLDARVWFVEDAPVLIELYYPLLPHAADVLTGSLGEPAARVDYQAEVMPVPRGAWVYPDRGIALFMDRSGRVVMHIGLFPACELDHYLAVIHPDAESTEVPGA